MTAGLGRVAPCPSGSLSGQPALRLFVAAGFRARLLGLHTHPNLVWGDGLWLTPCRAIHTLGLRRAIDVVFLGRGFGVVREVRSLRPNRLAWCPRAWSVVELPAGYCAATPGYAEALARALTAAAQRTG
jgi:hypothetical protein